MADVEFSLLPVEEELKSRLSRLIKLRWVALECILISVWITEYALQIPLPSRGIYLISLGIFLYNIVFYFYLRSVEKSDTAAPFSRFAAAQIFFDWVALTLLVHLTGGIESPVILFFFFHAVISIILLPPGLFYLVSSLAVAFLATLSILEYAGVVGHVTLAEFAAGPRYQNPVFVFGMLFFFATAIYISTYLATAIIIKLRARDRELISLLEEKKRAFLRTQTLYDLSRTISSTLDIHEVLQLAARSTAEAMNVKACSVRILDHSRKKYELGGAYGLSEAYLNKGPLDADKSLTDALEGKVIFIPDTANDPRLQYPEAAQREGMVSMLVLPMRFKNDIIGSLRIHSAVKREFSDEEVDFASAIASTVSVAIVNAMAYKKVLEMDQARARFTMMVAHEMRAPVSAIQGILRIIIDGYTGEVVPKQRELLARAEARTHSFLALINDLLDLGSDKTAVTESALTPIAIYDVLRKVVGLLEVKTKEKGITVLLDLPTPGPVISEVGGDMEKLFTNLVGNAVKYTPSHGKVEVRVDFGEYGLKVVVSDTGVGIPAEDLPHVFEEFYRAKNARALEREGTGLGLPIVQRIVKRYGGEVNITSEPDQGTTVTVVFPKEKIRFE